MPTETQAESLSIGIRPRGSEGMSKHRFQTQSVHSNGRRKVIPFQDGCQRRVCSLSLGCFLVVLWELTELSDGYGRALGIGKSPQDVGRGGPGVHPP